MGEVMNRLFAAAVCAALVLSGAAAEPHVAGVVSNILSNVSRLRAVRPDAVPMAFWDFDGTILDGDVTEGLEREGKWIYKGLQEEAIRAGLNRVYAGEEGWRQFHTVDYPRMNAIGRWLAWPYHAQLFEGTCEADLNAFCAARYETVFSKHYFQSSIDILRALEDAGVENYVVSASAEIFVANAAKTLGIPRTRLRGIRVKIAGGRLTTELVYPIPYGEGKVENVRALVRARGNGVAVAGFGNSYSTDGAFLRYIVTQALPGGARGFALMINGGEPPADYRGLFTCVTQRAVEAARPRRSEMSAVDLPTVKDVTFTRQRLFPGFDGRLCKVQPSIATDGRGLAMLGFQKLLLSGGDVFYGQFLSRSTDGGRTWSEPREAAALKDTRRDGLRVAHYATVYYHAPNDRWYGLGQACTYKNDREPNSEYTLDKPYSWPIYVPLDPEKGEYGAPRTLEFPLPYAGCLPFGQQLACANGDVLVPFYYEPPLAPGKKRGGFDVLGRVIVVRYRFTETGLAQVAAGEPIACDGLRRGVGEPSLIALDGKIYITLRSDEMGMWAESTDGLRFSKPRPWTWTDGQMIGNANTQQHWMKAGGKLFLAYTRVTPANGHVFRNRAPVFLAQFDPARKGLLRETEFPIVPELGARLGNFCCAPCGDDAFWFVTAEWMQPRGCERYGSDNSIWFVRLQAK